MQEESNFPLVLPRWSIPHILEHPLEGLRDRVVASCAEKAFPALRDDPVFIDSLSRSVDENVRALRDVLLGAITLDDVPLENRLRFTNVEAQMRVTQVAMQRSYRLSFFMQWQEWSTLVASTAERLKVGATEQARAQQSLAATVMVYHDAVVSQLSANLARSEEALSSSRHHVRQRLIQALLQDGDYALDPADLVTLDYAVDAEHIAVLLTETSLDSAGKVLETLRRSALFDRSLLYGFRMNATVLWLSNAGSPWSNLRLQQLAATLRDRGYTASISEPRSGRAGLGESLEQAERIERIRRNLSYQEATPVLQFAEVRLEMLLTQTPELARDFVQRELGPLAENTAEAARLRDTIAASFQFGSHVATADNLGLHEHTVRNRLQRAQEILGPLQERRTEIQVALRLWRIFGRS